MKTKLPEKTMFGLYFHRKKVVMAFSQYLTTFCAILVVITLNIQEMFATILLKDLKNMIVKFKNIIKDAIFK